MLDQEMEFMFENNRKIQAQYLKRRTTIGTKQSKDPLEILRRVQEDALNKKRGEINEEQESLQAIEFALILSAPKNDLPTINNRQFQQILKLPGVINELSFILRDILID